MTRPMEASQVQNFSFPKPPFSEVGPFEKFKLKEYGLSQGPYKPSMEVSERKDLLAASSLW